MGKSSKQKSSLVKHSNTKRQNQGGASSKHGGGTQVVKPSAFKVSSHRAMKAKHKAKQVTSNLKRMNSKSSKEQVSKNNASFASVQQTMTSSKSASKQAPKQSQAVQGANKKSEVRAQVDVDAAMEQMASL